MRMKSVWAVTAGGLFVVGVTTIVDVVLHLAGAYPPMNEPIDNAQAVLGTSYRIVIGIAGAWLTARLAPSRPMWHAMILGCIGAGLGLIGLVFTWNTGLGPRWYGVAHVVLALPETWIGGRIYQARQARIAG